MSYAQLLNQTLTLKTKTGYSRTGRPQISAGSSVVCRFQEVKKTKLDAKGNVIDIDGIVFVPGTTTIENEDVVTYGSTNYKVIGKNTVIARYGSTHHIELEVQKWAA